MKKVLTKDQILNMKDFETKRVMVPEWKGEVIVRVMNGRSRDLFEQECRNRTEAKTRRGSGVTSLEGMKALVLSLTIVDEEGKQMFSQEDVETLNSKNGNAIDRIFQVACELNGLGPKQMENVQGN